MASIELPVSGNLRSQQYQRIKESYTQIFSSIWEDKPIWEHIRDNALTAAPFMTGGQYYNSPVRLMFVGRAVNGWEVPFEDCSTLETTVKSVIRQKNRLHEFADDFIEQEDGSKYYYARSPFLRLMRKTVGAFHGTEEDWYQRLCWSNLFKVAPRNGNNPSWRMIRDHIPQYREILQEEITLNQPDLVVFVTDMGYFDCYKGSKKYENFMPLLSRSTVITEQNWNYVQAAGSFGNVRGTKIVVCSRPERKSNDALDQMAAELRQVYAALSAESVISATAASLARSVQKGELTQEETTATWEKEMPNMRAYCNEQPWSKGITDAVLDELLRKYAPKQ